MRSCYDDTPSEIEKYSCFWRALLKRSNQVLLLLALVFGMKEMIRPFLQRNYVSNSYVSEIRTKQNAVVQDEELDQLHHKSLQRPISPHKAEEIREGTSRTAQFFPPFTSLEDLPIWIRNYVHWHQSMRKKFPGSRLFTDPMAPKILLRTCDSGCGGLHDRIAHLPWDLYLANQTGRVLLMNWCSPAPLETYLIPNLLNWSLPTWGVPEFRNKTCIEIATETLELFENFTCHRPSQGFWDRELSFSLQRAVTDSKFRDSKLLRHRILGNDYELSKRLRSIKEEDLFDLHYGKIFWTFFRLSPGLEIELERTLREELPELSPWNYSAIHVRTRHPRGRAKNLKGKAEGGIDRSGLMFDAAGKDFAVRTSIHAIRCLQAKVPPGNPIYIYSDSEDLVRYMTVGWKNETHRTMNAEQVAYWNGANQTRLVARACLNATLHISQQAADDPMMFNPSFIDLLIGSRASCIAYGVGNYGYFSAKISGTPCRILHRSEPKVAERSKQENSDVCK